MDQKLKERVFGALVVVAIAVIFVPMVLDNKHEKSTNLSQAMPAAPTAQSTDIAQGAVPQAIADLEKALEQKTQITPAQPTAASTHIASASQAATKAVPANTQAVADFKKARIAAAKKDYEEAQAAEQRAKAQMSAEGTDAQTVVAAEEEKIEAPKQKIIPTAKLKSAKAAAQPYTHGHDSFTFDDFMAANDETAMTPIGKFDYSVSHKTAKATESHKGKIAQKSKTFQPSSAGWAVQVGAFSNAENAKALEEKITRQGYKAFTHKFISNNRVLTKVMVGPEADRSQADNLKATLENSAHIQGVVTQYEPIA